MPRYWCVNFDADSRPDDRECILRHGIGENLWLMQYQYSHGGHTYQGHPREIRATTTSWNIAGRVSVSDWLVAYLKPSTFYAVGEVVEPAERARHANAPIYLDSIHRTVTGHSHAYSQHSQNPRGVVRYTAVNDQPPQLPFYEDFTDP